MSHTTQHVSRAPALVNGRRADVPGPTRLQSLLRNSRASGAARPRTVLLIDDDAAVRMVLTDALQDAGFSVTAVPDGFSALNSVRRVLPDVVILDLALPVLDGQEFVDAWTTVTPRRVVPILVLSATADLPPLLTRLGVEGHITKPFDIDLVVAAVSRMTTSSRA